MFWWFNTPYSRLRSVQRENRTLKLKVDYLSKALKSSESLSDRYRADMESLERQVKELQFMVRKELNDD